MAETNDGLKFCKYCGENISLNSRRCEYCGSLLENSSSINSSNTEKFVYSENKTIVENTEPIRNNDIVYSKPVNVNKSVGYMSNWLKVLLTVITTIIPGLGQLLGCIIGIVLMNSYEDKDKRSFGLALLVNSVIFFIISFLLFVLIIVFIASSDYVYY